MTTEVDDSEVMAYFWNNILNNDQDTETNKLCKILLDHFAVDSFHWFLKTTEEELMEYKDAVYTSSSTTLQDKIKLDDALQNFICCQWYAFYTLHTMDVLEMTAEEWKATTNQDQYINFVTSKYQQVKKNLLVCLLRKNYMNDSNSDHSTVENDDVPINTVIEDVNRIPPVDSTSAEIKSSCTTI
jgi:hypothetical protein